MTNKNMITMPKLSADMKEATIVSWNKALNDDVRKGDVLFEVETDKVVCEVEATCDGRLGEVYFEEGDKVRSGVAVAAIV